MYDFEQRQYYQDEPRIVYRDYQGEPIYEGDEYVECEGDKVLVDDVEHYALRYLVSPIKVAEYFDDVFND